MKTSEKHALVPFVEPRSVAIVGASASPGKAGYELLRNILANEYGGKVYPVNPKAAEILGLRVYPSVAELPEAAELGIVILPAESTVAAVRELAARGIGNVVLLAGGFAELDEPGARIQQELIEIIRATGIRVLGPNTSGHTSTPHCFTSAFFPLGKIRRGAVSVDCPNGEFRHPHHEAHPDPRAFRGVPRARHRQQDRHRRKRRAGVPGAMIRRPRPS